MPVAEEPRLREVNITHTSESEPQPVHLKSSIGTPNSKQIWNIGKMVVSRENILSVTWENETKSRNIVLRHEKEDDSGGRTVIFYTQ